MGARRTHPQVNRVQDLAAQESLRLLWDRVFNLEDGLTAANATIREQAQIIVDMTEELERNSANIQQALAASGKDTAEGDSGAPIGEGGGGGTGVTDDGEGAAGCSNAGDNGHVPGGSSLTAELAGQIICGTGNEFPSLKAATVDLPTREANALELLLRMIWHLQQAGFSAGRQQNPSGAISKDKLTFQIAGETTYRAYDVFFSYDEFTIPLGTQMVQTGPAKYVATGGTPD